MPFLFCLCVAFAPVAAVIVVNYVFFRRSVYDTDDDSILDRLANRPIALLAWTLGVISAMIRVTGIAALDALLVSGVSYYAMSRLYQ